MVANPDILLRFILTVSFALLPLSLSAIAVCLFLDNHRPGKHEEDGRLRRLEYEDRRYRDHEVEEHSLRGPEEDARKTDKR